MISSTGRRVTGPKLPERDGRPGSPPERRRRPADRAPPRARHESRAHRSSVRRPNPERPAASNRFWIPGQIELAYRFGSSSRWSKHGTRHDDDRCLVHVLRLPQHGLPHPPPLVEIVNAVPAARRLDRTVRELRPRLPGGSSSLTLALLPGSSLTMIQRARWKLRPEGAWFAASMSRRRSASGTGSGRSRRTARHVDITSNRSMGNLPAPRGDIRCL